MLTLIRRPLTPSEPGEGDEGGIGGRNPPISLNIKCREVLKQLETSALSRIQFLTFL